MRNFARLFIGAAAVGALAAPEAAQYYPQQTYPQTYPQPSYSYPQQGYAYPNPGYAYPQQQGGIAAIIGQLLGNRYSVTDRQAVTQCATAAQAQVAAQYRGNTGYGAYGQQPYGQAYGNPYGQQYGGYGNAYGTARVTAITNVERRQSGLRVSGVINSGMMGPQGGYGGYGGYGAYGGQSASPYAAQGGDLTFRCNVDYRGAVTNLRLRRNPAYRPGY